MLKKRILLLFFGLFPAIAVLSQHLSHQVIVSAAGVISPKGVSYSQTMGETAVEVTGDFDYVLTQGFQQPRLKITFGVPPQGTGVESYPNPAVDYVTVELFGETGREFRITIINLNGTALLKDEVAYSGKYWEKRKIQISDLAKGFYIIHVISTDGVINRSFKLEKL
jgi:hypothetical protein